MLLQYGFAEAKKAIKLKYSMQITDQYLEPSQSSKEELFAKMINGF